MVYQQPTQEECFRKWIEGMKWRQAILEESGYTTDQAIEMLKVYELASLEGIEAGVHSIN